MYGGTKREDLIAKAGIVLMTADYAMQVRVWEGRWLINICE